MWIEEDDSHLNPMGFKGIGEIGIVGTAAAIAKRGAPRHGHRVRDLPIRLDRLLAMFIEGGSAGRVAGRRGAESLDVE